MAEVVVGVLIQLGEPDHFLGVNTLAVNDSGDLPVRAACVKADPAAVHIAAHGLRHFVGSGTFLQRQIQNLQIPLIELIDKGVVEMALTLGSVSLLQALGQLAAAADGHTEAAGGPQQELHIALHIAVVGLGHFGGAMDEGSMNGDTALIPLHRNGHRLPGILQVCRTPDTKRNKGGVQLGRVFHLVRNS